MQKAIRSFNNMYPSIGERVYVDPQAVIIGDVTLGNDCSVWPMAVIRGDVNSILIGHSSNIQDGVILHVTHDGPYSPGGRKLILGAGVTVAHKAILHACKIDDFCLIGMGALVMDGVHAEHHSMIAAGSVVPPGKTLQSGYLYLGNPARAVRLLTDNEIGSLEYSAQNYIRLKNQYLS